MTQTFTRNDTVETLARIAHETNRAYCLLIGDTSQPSWDDAPDWQRDSAINGVYGVLDGNTPEQSHESWMSQKDDEGWVYGEVKDPEAKTHPCMVPYGSLPEAQRLKDHLYTGVITTVASRLGILRPAMEGERFWMDMPWETDSYSGRSSMDDDADSIQGAEVSLPMSLSGTQVDIVQQLLSLVPELANVALDDLQTLQGPAYLRANDEKVGVSLKLRGLMREWAR